MKVSSLVISLVFVMIAATSCSSVPKVEPAPAPATTASPATAAKAVPESKATRLELKCEMKGDSRTITVVPKDEGCDLHYLKSGKSEVIASSAHGTEHCDQVRAKVRQNLEAAGFKCQ